MNIFKEYDTSKAICDHCKKIVKTTFKVRDTIIHDRDEKPYKVKNILVGVCDNCDKTVSIPMQSSAAISEVRLKDIKTTVDVRLPRHLLDILNNTIIALGIDSTSDKRGHLLRFYIASIITDIKNILTLKKNLNSPLLKGSFKRRSRLTLKFNSQLDEHFNDVMKATGLKQTEIIDSLIIKINNDVLTKKDKKISHELKIMLLANG